MALCTSTERMLNARMTVFATDMAVANMAVVDIAMADMALGGEPDKGESWSVVIMRFAA